MFLVHSTFVQPDLPAAEAAQLTMRESAAAAAFQRSGVLAHLWREDGTRNAWAIWTVETEQELRRVLATLPWSKHMEFEMVSVSAHPNSLDRREQHDMRKAPEQ